MGGSIWLGKSVAATVASAIAVPVPKAESRCFSGFQVNQRK
jgi:hypothetical protein